MLPNIMNKQNQSEYTAQTPQRPQLPSISDKMSGNAESRMTPPSGQRPVQRMSPDNGQWGGAPRYMSMESGAYNAAAKPMPTSHDNKPQKPYPGQPTRPPVSAGSPFLSLASNMNQPAPNKPPGGTIGLPPQPGVVSTGYQGQAQPLQEMAYQSALQNYQNQMGGGQMLPQIMSQRPQAPSYNMNDRMARYNQNMNQQQNFMNSIMGNFNTLRPIFSQNYQMPYIGPRGI